MNFTEYQKQARRTQNKALPLWAKKEHALYLLGAEVGEVLGMHQKLHQGHEMDEHKLMLEIGDILWGIAELCDVYDFEMDEVAAANIDKLWKRFPSGFDSDRSINREEIQDGQS